MAKGPAVVIVVRHGARLDAADKSWHLTSPTPYDPPLTYGGWSQAKALGQRIAALLHQRDSEQTEVAKDGAHNDPAQLDFSKLDISREGPDGSQRRKKRRKIVMHSSPFLRCVQTSTAIAAGISQTQSQTTPVLNTPTPSTERGSLLGSPVVKPSRTASPSSKSRSFQPVADPSSHNHPKPHVGPERILLRIDAFLGEWLSPDYYEDITSPPNSTMMVAGAKADLLRRGDYIQESNPHSSKGHFPGGWVRKDTAAASPQTKAMGAAPTVGSLAQAAPFRERSSSHGSFPSLQRSRSREAVPNHTSIPSRVYEPPQPSYSVSPADPIPRGYVAHAQEACVKVDFQWDSMRSPQNWGDGGEYGDEWSTMHKRFRKGLAGMMEWYRVHGTAPPKESFPGFMFREPLRLTPPPAAQPKPEPFPSFSDGTTSEEDEEELVLVLVTHGAGCNALLGAIQNQPVLMDIGLASLSMAVRRDEPIKSAAPTIHERRLSVADPGMSDTYEMKLLASVDHLRPGVDPSKLSSTQSRMQSPVVTASPSLDYRRRFTGSFTSNSPLESPFSLGEPQRSLSSSLSGVRRTMSSGSNSRFTRHSTSGTASPAGGLWSGTQTPATESSGADMVLNFANQHPSPKSHARTASIPIPESALETTNDLTKMDSKEEKEIGDKFTPLVSAQPRTKTGSSAGLWGAKVAPKANNGLWGPPKLDDVYEHSHGPKRRWTVTERGDGM